MAFVRSAGAAVCAAAALLLPSSGTLSFAEPRAAPDRSATPPVTLGEVAASPAEGSTRLSNLGELLRRDLEAELGAVDWKAEGLRRRYTLSAAVVRVSSAPDGDRNVRASCTVSASIRDAERSAVLAIVEGKAKADGPGAMDDAERDALAGAVHGAIRALPEAIRRAQ
ncbi:MAG: hypothetical protein U0359_35810 [Byssovorax sp.]